MSVDLRTRYLGLDLRSPIVASAAPNNADLAHALRLEDAGAGAIVLSIDTSRYASSTTATDPSPVLFPGRMSING